MTQEPLTVRKIREVLRLHHQAGLSNRAIARTCKVSNSTVGEYLERAEQAGVGWPLPDDLSDAELHRRLFPEKEKTIPEVRVMPNWEDLHGELAKRGVTLTLLWQEYREQHPDGYGFTQFRVHYQAWNKAHTNTMRLPHKGGEELELDYAGMTVPITNPETGEVTAAQVFVAALPASSYTYAEIQPSQELCHWLAGHVRAFAFFGGLPKIIRPDNLKSGIKSPNRYEPETNPSYQELAEHYGLAIIPARVRKPKDKAHVENSVQNVERWVLPKDIGTMWRPCGTARFSASGRPIGQRRHCSKHSTSAKWRTWVNRAGNYSKNWISPPCDRCRNGPTNLPPGKMPKSISTTTSLLKVITTAFRTP
jgi:transposase